MRMKLSFTQRILLAMVLSSAGLPLDGIALVAGVDRLFDMGRTVVNISGDTVAAVAITGRRGGGQGHAF